MNNTLYIQITAGRGPIECSKACEKVLEYICQKVIYSYNSTVISIEEDNSGNGIRSAVIKIKGLSEEEEKRLIREWNGTVKYISTKNSIRPNHRRKNWFIGISTFPEVGDLELQKEDLKWDTMRSHGPGGQHVNTTESAVRVTHIPTGISVRCDTSRNQLQNRELALKLLMTRIARLNQRKQDESKKLAWSKHSSLKRGDEILTLKGDV